MIVYFTVYLFVLTVCSEGRSAPYRYCSDRQIRSKRIDAAGQEPERQHMAWDSNPGPERVSIPLEVNLVFVLVSDLLSQRCRL